MVLIGTRKGDTNVTTFLPLFRPLDPPVFLDSASIGNNRHVQEHVESLAAREYRLPRAARYRNCYYRSCPVTALIL